MPKLASYGNTYTPLDFEYSKGLFNRDLPPEERIRMDITHATIGEKGKYMQFYSETGAGKNAAIKMFQNYEYDSALRTHVKRIYNLSDENDVPITNGAELVACKNPLLNDLKQDVFFRICGVRLDDGDDGPGELTVGENPASG